MLAVVDATTAFPACLDPEPPTPPAALPAPVPPSCPRPPRRAFVLGLTASAVALVAVLVWRACPTMDAGTLQVQAPSGLAPLLADVSGVEMAGRLWGRASPRGRTIRTTGGAHRAQKTSTCAPSRTCASSPTASRRAALGMSTGANA